MRGQNVNVCSISPIFDLAPKCFVGKVFFPRTRKCLGVVLRTESREGLAESSTCAGSDTSRHTTLTASWGSEKG